MEKLAVYLSPSDWLEVMKKVEELRFTFPEIVASLEGQLTSANSNDYRLSGEWLSLEEQQMIEKLWKTPKKHEDDSNPRVQAIQIIREKARDLGWKLDLKESTMIKDRVLDRVTPK